MWSVLAGSEELDNQGWQKKLHFHFGTLSKNE